MPKFRRMVRDKWTAPAEYFIACCKRNELVGPEWHANKQLLTVAVLVGMEKQPLLSPINATFMYNKQLQNQILM